MNTSSTGVGPTPTNARAGATTPRARSGPLHPRNRPAFAARRYADAETQRILGEAIVSVAGQLGLSGLHLTFPEKAEFDALGELGSFEQRLGLQYHWHNADYASFDDFLGALNSRKRKAIRKERREVAALDIDIRTLSGSEMTEALWDAFFDFYLNTSDRKWGQAYLTRRFFSLLSERCADDVVMVMAFEGGQPVAGALNFRGGDTLYGRNWGCSEDHKFLHFEACYYRAIDYAIEHGLARVEAGAQGQHKVQRGYLPTPTYSLHWIADPALQRPVANFVRQERERSSTRSRPCACTTTPIARPKSDLKQRVLPMILRSPLVSGPQTVSLSSGAGSLATSPMADDGKVNSKSSPFQSISTDPPLCRRPNSSSSASSFLILS